jgi:AcrR family transcriptional regulator
LYLRFGGYARRVTSRALETETPRPLRRDAQRNRERILDAARELFAERGVAVTLDDIAERAGVGVGTAYRHFPNKDALLDELFEEGINEFADLAKELLASSDAWRAFVGFLERLEEASAANRALEHLIMEGGGRPRCERIACARERLDEPIAALVERAKKQGELRADFEASDVFVIHSMLAAVGRETQGSSPELWKRYFAIVVDGLSSSRSSITETGVAPPAPPRRR